MATLMLEPRRTVGKRRREKRFTASRRRGSRNARFVGGSGSTVAALGWRRWDNLQSVRASR